MTYLLSSDDITQSPVAFNSSLLGSVANLWKKLNCERQKLCPHSLHICLGSRSGPGVSKLQMRYVLCKKGSRWASPATPTMAAPSRKLSQKCAIKQIPWRKVLDTCIVLQITKNKKNNYLSRSWGLEPATGLRVNFRKTGTVSHPCLGSFVLCLVQSTL